MNEGIQLPTVVIVGDQSSENLVLSNPWLVLVFLEAKGYVLLEFCEKVVDADGAHISEAISSATEKIAGNVTRVDKSPKGLQEKVLADDVNISLGYVCVRNRIGDETYDEARAEEARLFHSHPLLSKMDKSIVGVPVLAQKLVQTQGTSIAKFLPDTVKKISEKLNKNAVELDNMPRHLSNIASDAITAFMLILGSAKESPRKILITGELHEFPDESN
ncbi:hypothetical protein C5167_016454 [Papaver somniferum]|nr:hypothetical protein C5167_016454 [Papaver somniferum]